MTHEQMMRWIHWKQKKSNLEFKIYDCKVKAWVQLGVCVLIFYLAFTITLLCLPQALLHWAICWAKIQGMRDNISLLVREEMLGFDREIYD